MCVDDAEDMIMLRVFDFVHSDLNLFIKLDDNEKETLYMSAAIMSPWLIFRNVSFSFSIAYYSCLVDCFFFEFFDSLQNHCIILAIDMFIDEANKILQIRKAKIFKTKREIHDEELIDEDEMKRSKTRWEEFSCVNSLSTIACSDSISRCQCNRELSDSISRCQCNRNRCQCNRSMMLM